MKDDQIKLEEQSAPLKNTDNAFVQVNKDGSPSMPEQDAETHSEEQEKPGSEEG